MKYLNGVHWKITKMKIIESTVESIIIVLACILIILPEILYSIVLRGRDWIIDRVMNYKSSIKKKRFSIKNV